MQTKRLWEDRLLNAQIAARGLADVQSRLFPADQLVIESIWHKMNDYILTCYERIADPNKEENNDQ